MSDDCIFCAIVAGDIPSRTVYEDDDGGPIHAAMGTRPDLNDEELDDVAASIRDGR